jgi:hypothetical protein
MVRPARGVLSTSAGHLFLLTQASTATILSPCGARIKARLIWSFGKSATGLAASSAWRWTMSPSLHDTIADFIREYRTAELVPALMLQAVLAEFPDANESDFAIALATANRRRPQ